ncbi:MAG: flagellar protein FlbD [Deltaproteobacteria bacterium]|nr:flagellar protein FlbD [Deltaproteobacteria bacterium]TLN04801.1 MAG: flagellar protein FlbD [bacterium]
MIKLTRLDGSQIFVNEDLIEVVEETPDTHITLSNGNRYVVLESTAVLIERIISFKARIFARSGRNPATGKKYLRRRWEDSFQPFSKL